MIIHPKPFDRIVDLKNSKEDYKFILLYIKRNPHYTPEQLLENFENEFIEDNKLTFEKLIYAEVIFTNLSLENIKYLMKYFPLMIIYDKERFEIISNYSYNLKPIFDSVLNRKLSATNSDEITNYFNSMNYKYIIENKDIITQKISNLFHLDKILKEFKELDKHFLKESNHIAIRKRTDLSIEEFMKPTLKKKRYKNKNEKQYVKENKKQYGKESEELKYLKEEFHSYDERELDYSNYNYVSGYFQKKNINHILKKYNSEELKKFFYYGNIKDVKGKSEKEDLKIENNKFYNKDREEMLSILEHKNNTSQNTYKELLKEIEYCNLYEWNYTLAEYEFEDIFLKLYSHTEKNQITSLSTKHTDKDYLVELFKYANFDCEEKIEKQIREEFDYIDRESIRDTLIKEFKNNYSELQMIESYIEDRLESIEERKEELYKQCMEQLKESMGKDYLFEYIDSLKQGKTKHSKYKK